MSAERWSMLRDARQLLSLLDGEMAHSVPQRKWQHFGTACCREVWQLLTLPQCRRIVEIAEMYTDGTATIDDVETARVEVDEVGCRLPQDSPERATVKLCHGAVIDFESYASSWAARAPARHTKSVVEDVMTIVAKQTQRGLKKKVETLQLRLAALLHDIFGNPFRPVTFDPAWRTEHTVGLAGKMYDERDFAAMPILADALEEAGCDNAGILSHCREPGVHVRGCWVVDLVLGK